MRISDWSSDVCSSDLAGKYFSRAIAAQVTFGRGPHDNRFTCDIVAHVMQGLVLKGANDGTDAYGAFDGAAHKIEKQLRRYMRRLKDRNQSRSETRRVGKEGGSTCRSAG